MEAEMFKIMATQGVFALLFCYLLLYVLKENSKRESNYQAIIKELTNVLPIIKDDIEEIKKQLFK
ncbi:BhlA/UviB family holin-like peptide [Desnuesiella massiliensis]|uniref:BhlA/UviB family holin-like peptide n=1 Tax=Desnuesiella massiliensis TaxID=1650662 RepID=UPI0006E13E24|nr:BhlA/UviB family holin-like peptide [Desnuesiella massiliensis]